MCIYLQRPLIPLGAAAAAGCFAGGLAAAPGWLGAAAGAAALAAGIFRFRRADALIWLATAVFGVYFGLAANAARPRGDDITRWIPRRDIRLEGRLDSFPETGGDGRGWIAYISCRSAVWHGRRRAASGRVRCFIPGPMPAWNPGDEIGASGALADFDPPNNPGEFDYRQAMRIRGVSARLSVPGRGDAVRLRAAPAWTWEALAGGFRRRAQDRIQSAAGPRAAGLVRSLVLGDRSGLNRRRQEIMAAAGLAHILAVSGFNVSLVFASLFGVARGLGIAPRPAVLLGLAGVAVFTAAAGGGAPVARAAWMAAGAAAGWLGSRNADPGSGLALAALILLARQPSAVQEPGFQLSFAATVAIILAVPHLPRPGGTWIGRLFCGAAGSLAVTAAASLGTAPLCLHYFYSVTPAALFTNLAAVPLVTAATDGGLWLGVCGGLIPALDRLVGGVTGAAAAALEWIAARAAEQPGARVFAWPASAAWVAVVYAALAGCAAWKRGRPWCSAALAACLALYPTWRPAGPGPGEIRATFLDLGIGEATLVETQHRRLLIDTGTEAEFLWRVKPFLAARGINRVDALLLSHGDDDHAGGAEACLAMFRPRRVWHGGFESRQERAWRRILRRRGRRAVRLAQGDRVDLGPELALAVLWPPPGANSARNRACLAVAVQAPGGVFLFTGDSSDEVDQMWDVPRPCAVLKAAHHGARRSSSERFLCQATPRAAVIMPGARNPFGFPHPETRSRLERCSQIVLDAGRRGATEITLRPDGELKWRTWK